MELSSIYNQLKKEYNEKVELKEVLLKGRSFFETEKNSVFHNKYDQERLIDVEEAAESLRFSFITGVIDRDERPRIERMRFRATRGNCYIKFTGMGKLLGNKAEKLVFLIFYRTPSIRNLLIKICDAFGAKRFDVPMLSKASEVERSCHEIDEYFVDSNDVLEHSFDNLHSLLSDIANNITTWEWIVKKEKLIYHTLNKCDVSMNGMLRAEGWILKSEKEAVTLAVKRCHDNILSHGMIEKLPSKGIKPPTYFPTNYFTSIYQSITDTYGVARYGEANPSLFTLVTFPFMFGMMFGDLGHCIFIIF